VAPSRVFAVTFTNRRRARCARGCPRCSAPTRAACGSAPSTRCPRACCGARRPCSGSAPNFTIYDQDDSESFIKRLLEQRGHSPKANPRAPSHAIISGAKNRMLLPEELGASADGPLERVAAEIYRARSRAAAGQRDGLRRPPPVPLTLFAERPERLAYWQRRFDHVLVDEFQEPNAASIGS